VPEPEDAAAHETSLAVWDVTSPVVAGRAATLNVGMTCRSSCDLCGTRIDVYNENGTRIGGGQLGPAPLAATTALYWTAIEVVAPDVEGEHAWSVEASSEDPSHGRTTSTVRCIAVRPPEHRVTLRVVQKGTTVPLAGVELRLGVFRAATDEAGITRFEAPAGTYEVAAWKIGYDLLSTSAHVAADTTIDLEIALAAAADQPYWM
jgi:hypothetical protein